MTVSFVFSLIFKVTRLHAYMVLFVFNLIPFRTRRNSILTLYGKISFHSNRMDQERVYCIFIFFFFNITQFLVNSFWETQRIEISFLLRGMKNIYISDISSILNLCLLCLFLIVLFFTYIYNLIFHIHLCNIYFIYINFWPSSLLFEELLSFNWFYKYSVSYFILLPNF